MKVRSTVIDAIQQICLIFNRECSNELIKAWGLALSNLSDFNIAYGLKRILTEYTDSQMPTPAKFCFYATSGAGVRTVEQEAEQAWHELEKSIKQVGSYRSVYFQNAVIAEFVRNQGGWPGVCRWFAEEMKWKRKEFISEYTALRQSSQCFEHVVEGITDCKNRLLIASGESQPQIAYIGSNISDGEKHNAEQEVVRRIQSQKQLAKLVSGQTESSSKVIPIEYSRQQARG